MAAVTTELKVLVKAVGKGELKELEAALNKLAVTARTKVDVNFKKVSSELKNIQSTSTRSIKNLRDYRNAWRDIAAQLDISSKEFKEATAEAAKLDAQLAKAEKRRPAGGGGRLRGAAQIAGTVAGAGVFGGPEGAIGAAIGAIGGPAGSIVGGAIGAQVGQIRKALGATAEYAAELKKLRIALQGVTTSNEQYSQALQAIEQGTKDYAIPQEILTKQFTKLQASVQGAGGNLNDTKTAFNGIVAAVRATGGSLQDVDSALTATAQVFSKGKVSAEELRQQIGERLPGAFSLFAESIGKTPQELDKALEDGKVSLQDFQTFSEALFERYGENAKMIASGPEAAGDRLQVVLGNLNENVGALLAPIGASFQETFIAIANAINGAVKALDRFFGASDQARIAKNTVLIQAANKSLADVRKQRAAMQKEIDEGGDLLGTRASQIRDYDLAIESITKQRQRLRDEINARTRPEDIQRPTGGDGLPGITPGGTDTKTGAGRGRVARADFSMLEGAFARDAALRVLKENKAIEIEILKAEFEGNKAQVFALKQKQERLKVNQIIVSLEELTRQRAIQIVNAQSKGLDVARVQSKQLDDQNNLQLARIEKEALLTEQEVERLKFNKEITAELDKQRKSFEDQFLDRQRELGLISSGDYNQVLLGRERERLADPGLGLTPEQQSRGLEQYRQTIDPTLVEGLTQNIAKLKEDLAELVNPINQVTSAATAIGTAFSDSFKSVIEGSATTQEALAGFFRNIASYFLDMAVQIIQKMITMYTLNTVVGLLPGLGGGGGGDIFSDIAGRGGLRMANGGVFAKNKIVPYAKGGIVKEPTMFAYADGGAGRFGLMGEAGPEAIMPLRRGANGKLGVQASGGGGVSVGNINITVENKGDQLNPAAQKQLAGQVQGIVLSTLANERRSGGML